MDQRYIKELMRKIFCSPPIWHCSMRDELYWPSVEMAFRKNFLNNFFRKVEMFVRNQTRHNAPNFTGHANSLKSSEYDAMIFAGDQTLQ